MNWDLFLLDSFARQWRLHHQTNFSDLQIQKKETEITVLCTCFAPDQRQLIVETTLRHPEIRLCVLVISSFDEPSVQEAYFIDHGVISNGPVNPDLNLVTRTRQDEYWLAWLPNTPIKPEVIYSLHNLLVQHPKWDAVFQVEGCIPVFLIHQRVVFTLGADWFSKCNLYLLLACMNTQPAEKSIHAIESGIEYIEQDVENLVEQNFLRDYFTSPILLEVEQDINPTHNPIISQLLTQLSQSFQPIPSNSSIFQSRQWLSRMVLRAWENAGLERNPPIKELTDKLQLLFAPVEKMYELPPTGWDFCILYSQSDRSIRLMKPGWEPISLSDPGILRSLFEIAARQKGLEKIKRFGKSKADLEISVIICTYRRSFSLRRALLSACQQTFSKQKYEILIVNNDPEDEAVANLIKEVLKTGGFLVDSNIRVIPCPVQGLSHARNTGIANARGAIICFADDDAVLDPTWLGNVWETFQNNPEAGVVGGKVVLEIPEPKPPVLKPGREIYWSQYIPHQDSYYEVTHWFSFPVGTNWSARRELLIQIGGFRVDYGRVGKNFAGGEELIAARLIQILRHKIGIQPKALVMHHVERSRFTLKNLWRNIVAGEVTRYQLEVDFSVFKNYQETNLRHNPRAPLFSRMVSFLRRMINPAQTVHFCLYYLARSYRFILTIKLALKRMRKPVILSMKSRY